MVKSAFIARLVLATLAALAGALDLDTTSKDSICLAASLLVSGTLDYYEGTRYAGTVGMFQEPYYWWQAGEAFGSLLDYNYFCPGNDTLQSLVHTGIVTQLGDNYDLMVSNFSTSEGNDDQGVWALTIMSAAERGFPEPSSNVSWAQVAVNAFNSMFSRWDDECKGGIRWQIFSNNNNGYGYKNSISNGALFTLAARLGRYFNNNARYLYIADFIWDWTANDVGFLVDNELDSTITIFDGGNIGKNCQDKTDKHWTYNYGIYLLGASYMYNATEDETWLHRAERLLTKSIDTFFNDDKILYESECQTATVITCNNDQRSFKAIFARSIAAASVMIPQLASTIDGLVLNSAKAAAESCSGGSDGHTCGLDWTAGKWDGLYGFGEEINALEIIQNLLIHQVDPPKTTSS